jgi:FkbM family methyltransferase
VWKLLRSPFESTWLEGTRLTLYPGNEISRSIFVTGRYEPNEFSFLSRVLKPGMTFVDVGANIGLFTLYAASRVGSDGRVLAFEPSPREMACLRENVQLNGSDNVTLTAAALWDENAELELLVAPSGLSGHNTLGGFAYDTALERRERVRARRLDDILQEQQVSKVDVIKIDVEGAELRALRGMTQILETRHPWLLLELSDRSLQYQGTSSGEVVSFLGAKGYRLYSFDRETGLPTTYRPSPDSQNVVAALGDPAVVFS